MKHFLMCIFVLVCPGYRQQFIPSEDSMKQYIRLDMDLNLFKGVWDTKLDRVIAPIKQQIVFNSQTGPAFSFDVIFDHDVPSKRYFNTTWEQIIETHVYKENENFLICLLIDI